MSAGPDVAASRGEALAGAAPSVFWLDDPQRPAPQPAPTADGGADLVVVGGGYTGLWTALLARERRPDRSVTLLEAGLCGWEASGRNGGFASASLTHGFGNGRERWPDELAELDRLGAENLAAIGRTVGRPRDRLRVGGDRGARPSPPGRTSSRSCGCWPAR